MASGRTPSLTISATAGTVVLVDEHSAWPPPPLASTRRKQRRETRQSSTGAGKTIDVYRAWNGSEQSVRGSVVHLLQAQVDILNAIHRADPPACSVTYMGETFDATLDGWEPRPDAFEPTEFQAEFELNRQSS